MKNQGQKWETMDKLAAWVEDYVEEGKWAHWIGCGGAKKQLAGQLDAKCKAEWKKDLLDKGERMLEKRRQRLHLKNL